MIVGAFEDLPGLRGVVGMGIAGDGVRSGEGNRVRRAESLRIARRLQLRHGTPSK